jgi:hypothetical protein
MPAFCDRDRIQTYNLLIRSQMLYSIELRSLDLAANIRQNQLQEKAELI